MGICKHGASSGITGAIGKWGAGLGSALGLATAVDLGVKAYTGYGLLETLSVPYIECSDGSFVSASEWYGGGLACPQKQESQKPITPKESTQSKVGKYRKLIESLGGGVSTVWGVHRIFSSVEGDYSWHWITISTGEGHAQSAESHADSLGNVTTTGIISEGLDNYISRGSGTLGGVTKESRAKRSLGFVNHQLTIPAYPDEEIDTTNWGFLGLAVNIPNRKKTPPSSPRIPSRNPPPSPTDSPNTKKDCTEMTCKCLTPKDIEKAVKKALGLDKKISPEADIVGVGKKMYASPGRSGFVTQPKDMVEAITALVTPLYMRAGYASYPVKMPSWLINDAGSKEIEIESFAEWFEWWIKQFDAVIGEFPIEIKIKDGEKTTPLKFENLSEALAEMTGLVIQTATDADAAVSCAAHAALAAVQATNAATIGQKATECLIRFFGVRTGVQAIFVESPVTPADPDNASFNLKDFLKPSQQRLAVWTDDDPFDFQAVLDRILRNSEIAKTAVAHDFKKGMIGDYTRNQKKYDEGEQLKIIKKEFETLEKQLGKDNAKSDFRVKIVLPKEPTSDIKGTNFVIKRKE